MEFFIPSLFVVLFATILVFLVVPRFGPVTMIVMSIAMLAVAIYHHANLFQSEYTSMTWNSLLISYGPFVMMGALLIFILSFVFSSYGGSVPVPSLPEGNAMTSIANTVASTANTIRNTFTGRRNNGYNKSFFNVV